MHIRRRFIAAALAVVTVAAPFAFPRAAAAYPGANVQLNGHGWGHGRGLSQYGSLGYALGGANYIDILNRYYSNTVMGSYPDGNGMSVRIVDGDNKDLIVVATNNYSVGPVNVPANYATRVRKVGANTFAIDTATNCGGGGGWQQQGGTVTGPVEAKPPSFSQGNNLGLMIQRCSTDTRGYRGSLIAYDDGTAHVRNQLTLGEYLRGVVPRESPASWGSLGGGAGMNALRAQTVAARSYAISSPAANYTTCDTTTCQVYGGAFLNGQYIEEVNTDNAITDTSGQIRTIGGVAQRTEFSSSSGGWTAGGTFPAVEDAGDAVAQNPNHNWSASIPVNTVQSAYPTIGNLLSININSRNGLGDWGGRVLSMTLIGSSGSVTTTGADFRNKLGLKSEWFNVTNSPSGGIDGYWMVANDGGLFTMGASPYYGSAGDIRLNRPIVGMANRSDNGGYWMVASDGGIFTYGSAPFFGSAGDIRLNQPVVGMAAKPDNSGYWIVARDGGIFTYGSAEFFGSTGSMRLNQPIVGMAATPTGKGYWLVAADGGIFTFGDAQFYGSTGSIKLAQPIAGMAPTPSGKGYWLVATDGGVFNFGDAGFFNSLPGVGVGGQQITGIIPTRTGNGYVMAALSGQAYSFGDAPQFGGVPGQVPGYRGGVVGLAPHFQ